MGSNQDVKELAAYLESDDVSVVRQVKQVIQENLYSSKDPWFLNSLFDLYLARKSDQLLDVLLGISEFKANQLFDKMNESLKQGLHTEVCTLLAAIVRKQPSWLYKVIGTQFFINFLKFLKCEDDVVLVMSGCYIISSLLPCVPSLIAPYLGEIMIIFYKFASLLVNHSVAVPDILLLHLQIGVYTLFQRLYSMYPNSFVAFMKENFAGQKQGDIVLNQVIKPMFSFVKFHPGLCTDTVKTETDNSKWKLLQPHDVVTECQKLSLDPLDTVREATYSVFPRPSLGGEGVGSLTGSCSILGSSLLNVTPVDGAGITKPPIELALVNQDSEAPKTDDKSFLSSQPLSTGFSPSELCGLSTPPHSRPQSPFESMEDSAVVIDHSARAATRVSLTESNREAASPVLHEQSSSGRYDDKTGSEEPAHLNLPPQTYSVETSPVLQRFNRIPKLNASESVVRRHGRLLNLALTASEPVEKLENLDRAYHSVPATPTQALALSRPYSDWFYSQSSQHGGNSSGEPKRVSPLPSIECKKRELELEDSRSTKLNSTGGGTVFNHSLDPGFTPIRSSPVVSRDGSPHTDAYQNVPIALISAIQELQRGFVSRGQLDVRRSSLEVNDPVSETHRLKSRTPMEILDEFIECGANVYSMELSRIPLTSQLDTDWTYFGGNSPADESSILKTQLKLMHLQLQYERHKCELQVLRNRRLVGKVRKAQDAADEVSILRNRVQLLESEQSGDRLSLRKREEENRNMKSMIKTSEDYYMSTIQTMREDRGKLKYEIAELSDRNAGLTKRVSDLEEEIRKKSITILENDSEIKTLKAQLVTNTDVKLKAENLAKELLTQQDRYEQLRDKMKTFSIYCNESEEKKLIIQSLKHENAALQEEKQTLVSTLDAAKIRIQDLEVALGKKEIAVREHKNNIESLRHQHSCEVKALESKYKSLNRACQALEAYVMHLYAKLEESGCQIHHSHGHAASGHEERTHVKDNHSTSSYASHKHQRGMATRHTDTDPERQSTHGTDNMVDSVVDSGIVE